MVKKQRENHKVHKEGTKYTKYSGTKLVYFNNNLNRLKTQKFYKCEFGFKQNVFLTYNSETTNRIYNYNVDFQHPKALIILLLKK